MFATQFEPLPADFFARSTLDVARELIGALLVHAPEDEPRCVGRIVETEAYRGDDPACHAWTTAKKPNPNRRGAALFGEPGTAYVYFNYGVHWMLNVVTESHGVAGAVLFRAVEPLEGLETMRRRRPVRRDVDLTNGPGKLTVAFGIDVRHHGTDLTRPPLFFAAGEPLPPATSTRIGITRGVELPWRFFAAGNRFVSPGRPSVPAAE